MKLLQQAIPRILRSDWQIYTQWQNTYKAAMKQYKFYTGMNCRHIHIDSDFSNRSTWCIYLWNLDPIYVAPLHNDYSPNRNDLDPYNSQYDVAIDLSSKLLRYKLISILFKIRDVVYVQITNISLASRLMCRSRSLTAVTSHRLVGEIRCTLSSDIISYMHLNGENCFNIRPTTHLFHERLSMYKYALQTINGIAFFCPRSK